MDTVIIRSHTEFGVNNCWLRDCLWIEGTTCKYCSSSSSNIRTAEDRPWNVHHRCTMMYVRVPLNSVICRVGTLDGILPTTKLVFRGPSGHRSELSVHWDSSRARFFGPSCSRNIFTCWSGVRSSDCHCSLRCDGLSIQMGYPDRSWYLCRKSWFFSMFPHWRYSSLNSCLHWIGSDWVQQAHAWKQGLPQLLQTCGCAYL